MMLFAILFFMALAFIYDLLRSLYKNSKKQIELLEQLKEQNIKIISLNDEKIRLLDKLFDKKQDS